MESKQPKRPPASPAPAAFAGVNASHKKLVAAFAEWDRRWREEPERFMSEATHILRETPDSYGELAAAYLVMILQGG